MEKYDIVIIGGGPAGFTSAIYAARRRLKTLVLIKEIGGQAAKTNEIENFPGFKRISGFELMEKMKSQAQEWGAQTAIEEVKQIVKEKNGFKVKGRKEYLASALILSFGLKPKKLELPGEEKLIGRGITYCATCDGPLFKNKVVAVAGGGNAAMEAAEYLAKLAKKVLIIHRSDEFRAEPELISQVRAFANVEFICFSRVAAVKGEKKLTAIVVENSRNSKKEELSLDGLFVEIGYEADSSWVKDLVKLNEKGEIVTDKDGRTSAAGIFAAGDCADGSFKQIVIAAGAGATAALSAYKYIIASTGAREVKGLGKCELIGTDKVAKVKLEK